MHRHGVANSRERKPVLNITKFIAAFIVLSLVGMPTISFAKARGGSGGGFSSGSRSGGSSGSMGSRGSRPIRTTAPNRSNSPPRPSRPRRHLRPHPLAQRLKRPLPRNLHGCSAIPCWPASPAASPASWIGHMIFGATDSSARTTENGERESEGAQAAGASGPNWMLILLMVMGAGGLYYYFKGRRTPAPDFSGISRSTAVSGSLLAESSAVPTLRTATIDSEITRADKTAFQQSLIEIQTAWSKQDLVRSAQARHAGDAGILQHRLGRTGQSRDRQPRRRCGAGTAEIRESWVENTAQYATVNLTWTARDYTVSTTKQPGETGYFIEGNRRRRRETTEVWTFMRYQHGNGCSPPFSRSRRFLGLGSHHEGHKRMSGQRWSRLSRRSLPLFF